MIRGCPAPPPRARPVRPLANPPTPPRAWPVWPLANVKDRTNEQRRPPKIGASVREHRFLGRAARRDRLPTALPLYRTAFVPRCPCPAPPLSSAVFVPCRLCPMPHSSHTECRSQWHPQTQTASARLTAPAKTRTRLSNAVWDLLDLQRNVNFKVSRLIRSRTGSSAR